MKTKTLIIGAADLYDWKDIRLWATSIRKVEYTGDVVLIVYRVTPELITKCTELGITVLSATHDDMGNPINHNAGGLPTQSHRLRNFHIIQYLESVNQNYDWVVVTDTRDVLFQANPAEFFYLYCDKGVYMPSEDILIKDEQWNGNMINQFFGPYIYDKIKDKMACNSGTFFGEESLMKRMLLSMYLAAKPINHTGSDQPAMNVVGHLIHTDFVNVLPMDIRYAIQCGTVLDPSKSHLKPHLLTAPSIVKENGIVCTANNQPYVIVHQYDRVPELHKLILERTKKW